MQRAVRIQRAAAAIPLPGAAEEGAAMNRRSVLYRSLVANPGTGFYVDRERRVVRDLEVLHMDRAYKTLHRPEKVQEKLAGDPRGKVKAAAERLVLD